MFGVVSLAKDIVSPVLNARGLIVPVGALIARLVVDMHPNFWRRRDQHPRRDTSDGAWPRLSTLAMSRLMAS